MSLRTVVARLVLGLIVVVCGANSGICDDKEELLQVAKEIKLAIEQSNPSVIMRYIHGTTCFGDDCYKEKDVANTFKDKIGRPSDMLFYGENSVRKFFMEASGLDFIINKEDAPDYWRIAYFGQIKSAEFIVEVYLFKYRSGWRINQIIFG